MFEFHYCIDLSIVHPSVDPKKISKRINSLRITREVMAGSDSRDNRGNLRIPHRKAQLTHWSAALHEEERIYSGDINFSQFIGEKLMELEQYQDLFLELGQEGEVTLFIGWFSESNASATLLEPEVLKKCGEIGIGMELNFYSPPSDE